MRAFATGMSALALLGVVVGARALASQPATTPPAPAPAEALPEVSGCQACHGTNGISSSPRVPNLAGQQPDYLVAQLKAFKAGVRKHDLMEAIAARLDDAQIAALAKYWSSRPAGGVDVHAAAAGPAIRSRMTFPAGFPTGFTLYRTVDAGGGVTERYANAAAVAAVRAGKPLPDGSVIVVVNRATAGGEPTNYTAMESRAGWDKDIPEVLRNGNWDYASFDAKGARNDRLNQAPCLACHIPQAANSFVFTLGELKEKVRPAG